MSSNSPAHEVGYVESNGGPWGCPCVLAKWFRKQPRSLLCAVCGGIRGGGRRRCHLGCHVGVISCEVETGWPPSSLFYMQKSKVSQAVSVHLFGTPCK